MDEDTEQRLADGIIRPFAGAVGHSPLLAVELEGQAAVFHGGFGLQRVRVDLDSVHVGTEHSPVTLPAQLVLFLRTSGAELMELLWGEKIQLFERHTYFHNFTCFLHHLILLNFTLPLNYNS